MDQGRIVVQGPIASLTSGHRKIAVGSDHPAQAAALLAHLDGVQSVTLNDTGLEVSMAANGTTERHLVTAIVQHMLGAGLAIDRVTPVEATLEERFLNLTTTLEESR